MSENCFNCAHKNYCSLFDSYLQESFDSDLDYPINDVCPRYTKGE